MIFIYFCLQRTDLTQVGHWTLGRLLAYVMQIAIRVAEGVAGYVEVARIAKC